MWASANRPKVSLLDWCDFTSGPLNLVQGCQKLSEGCEYCFAEGRYHRYGMDFSQVRYHEDRLEQLRTYPFIGEGRREGTNRKIALVCGESDLFLEEVPDDFIHRALDVMEDRPDLDWLIMTKRAERMRDLSRQRNLPDNIWLGVSVENKRTAAERIPFLLQTMALSKFLAVAPMLEPISFRELFPCDECEGCGHSWKYGIQEPCPTCEGLGHQLGGAFTWVFCAAELAWYPRPFRKEWALNLYAECAKMRVPFYYEHHSMMPNQTEGIEDLAIRQWPGYLKEREHWEIYRPTTKIWTAQLGGARS